jgi:hypothetical protein
LRDTVPIDSSLNLEPVSSHAGLVLLDQGLALLSRVIGFREQHAVIPGGLLGLADAAGLEIEMVRSVLSGRSANALIHVPWVSRWVLAGRLRREFVRQRLENNISIYLNFKGNGEWNWTGALGYSSAGEMRRRIWSAYLWKSRRATTWRISDFWLERKEKAK